VNPQQYLEEVLKVIKGTFRPNDSSGSMPVSTAAYLVKFRTGHDHTTFGFAKFKDVLAELERQGLVRTGTNSKHAYALWLTDAAGTSASPETPPLQHAPYRPLRNPVWFAFVSESQQGRRFLNRITGEVRVGVQDAPGGDWVEIVPISPAKEKEEANRFLSDNQLDSAPEPRRALSSARWYYEFPQALATIDQQLASRWKRQRSNRVLAEVEALRTRHHVEAERLFEPERPRSYELAQQRQPAELRQILLNAVQHLSTEQLLDLQIPARLLIAAVRPDLLIS